MRANGLEAAKAIPGLFRRKLFIVALVEEELRGQAIQPVVVGGTAVEWYTKGLYQSADLDLPGPPGPLDKVLGGMGFEKGGGGDTGFTPVPGWRPKRPASNLRRTRTAPPRGLPGASGSRC